VTSCARAVPIIHLDHGHDTMVMTIDQVSKSRFKARALELFRQVEQSGQPLIITDRGVPVLKLIPFEEDLNATLAALRGTVLEYTDPTEPVDEADDQP
jgi:prevent-host-death family protein